MSLSLVLCILSFSLCYWASRRSLVSGVVSVLAIGYGYGITRANLVETYSHFIFDAAVVGLYAAQLFHRLNLNEKFKTSHLIPWLEFLIAWPVLLFFVPVQDYLIQFVGLRGSIFLLPFVFFGARLDESQRYRLALWVAGFNLVVFVLAGTEYFLGIESFFPHNRMTELIYVSKIVIGQAEYRIPASFVNAHAYGGTMVMGLPLLLGAAVQKVKTTLQLQLLVAGIVAALLGVLMSGARTHFVAAAILVIVATFSLRSKLGYALGWILLIAFIGWGISGEQRLQRFMELRDTDAIAERISWSVNMTFVEVAGQYPFGNGLGGGGTSIPYFLQGRIINPVTLENEYARIMLEQGLIGLLMWALFVVWVTTRRDMDPYGPWYLGRRLARIATVTFFLTGLTGTGLLTSIPQTALFLLLVGWVGARQEVTEPVEGIADYDHVGAQFQVEQLV